MELFWLEATGSNSLECEKQQSMDNMHIKQ